MKKELVLLFTIPAILINIVLVLASNQFENIFSNFDTGGLGFLISLIPLIFLLFITYVSIIKASRSLMTLQLLLWWVFTFYMCIRALAFLDPYYNLGFMPQSVIDFFSTENVPTDETQKSWFLMSIYINAGVGLLMSFGNKAIRKALQGV